MVKKIIIIIKKNKKNKKILVRKVRVEASTLTDIHEIGPFFCIDILLNLGGTIATGGLVMSGGSRLKSVATGAAI